MRLSPAGQRFYQEVQKGDGRINLAAAALYIAQEDYWEMDASQYLERLDEMAREVRSRLPKGRYPLKVIKVINEYLFEELKFSGNSTDYYDPDNSHLNCVLDRRLGIPITLSLVYLEIAKRLRFPMVGVGIPGHFLIRPVVDEMTVLVDPFHAGETMFLEDCKERFHQQFGGEATWKDEFLSGVFPKAFLARMLTNLKVIYLNNESFSKAVTTLDKLLLLMPREPRLMRDRGLLHYELKNYGAAQQDLAGYLRSYPRAPDKPQIQKLLNRIGQ
ncbi:MAG: tetratricopeptide repeat protein [Cyanobacteria bacterium P01_D01_bin.105]